MKNNYHVVRRALLTEKTSILRAENKYVFAVDQRAGKAEIKKAIEELFSVEVLEVRTMNVRGKIKRLGRHQGKRADWKKAIITLAADNTIDLVSQA
ncbi:MAG: 50S ribosomal protein L23 [bacterium]|nr:50S ribosomal protein L23 [bacterium]